MGIATMKTNTKAPSTPPSLFHDSVESGAVRCKAAWSCCLLLWQHFPPGSRNQGVGVVKRLLPTSDIQSRPYKASSTGSTETFTPTTTPECLSPAQDLSLLLRTHQFPCNIFSGACGFSVEFKEQKPWIITSWLQ